MGKEMTYLSSRPSTHTLFSNVFNPYINLINLFLPHKPHYS